MSALLFLLFILCSCYFLWSRRHLYQLTWKYGGKLGLPLLGSFFDYLNVTDFGEYLQKAIWSQNKSPCAVWLGNTLHIAIRDPLHTHMVLTSNDLLNKHTMYKVFYTATGTRSIISSKAELWKVQRRILDATLSYKRVNDLIPPINKAIDMYINDIIKPIVGKGEVNIHKGLIRLIVELTMENIAGQNLKWLEEKSNFDVFGGFHTIQNHVETRVNKVYLHNDFLNSLTSDFKKIQKTLNRLHVIMQELVLDNYSESSLIYTQPGRSVCDTLRKHKGEEGFSDIDNRYHLGTFINASYETSTFALFMTICYLTKYPEYQEKVFEELLSYYPEKYPKVEADTINELQYLEMVISEVLRLHPSVPLIGRFANKDTTLRDGTFIPKGVGFLIDIVHLHRNEDIWGPKANKFNPENFLPENRSKRHPGAYIPFSFGPRNCIGIRYAKVAMRITLAKLFRTFKFTGSFDLKDIEMKRGLAMQLTKPPFIAVEERPF